MEQGSHGLGEKRRDDPADDENNGKSDDPRDCREECVERPDQRGLESVTGVTHRDGNRCTLHNASTHSLVSLNPQTGWAARNYRSVTTVSACETSVRLAPEAATDDQLD